MLNDQAGKLVADARGRAYLTQADLAGKAGVSPQTISDIETGNRRSFRRATIYRIADALHLEAELLFEAEEVAS